MDAMIYVRPLNLRERVVYSALDFYKVLKLNKTQDVPQQNAIQANSFFVYPRHALHTISRIHTHMSSTNRTRKNDRISVGVKSDGGGTTRQNDTQTSYMRLEDVRASAREW